MKKNINNVLKITTIFALGAIIAISPAVGFAKEKDNKDQKDNKNNKENCLRVYGHLISPGWFKLRGESTLEANTRCRIPKGIEKKLSDWHQNNNNKDAVAPVISSIVVKSNLNNNVVRWNTDEKSTSVVYLSTSSPVLKSASTTRVVTSGEMTKEHKVSISDLTASTTYYILVESKDGSGNVSTASQVSFQANVVPVVYDTKAPFISNLFAAVGSTTARIFWSTDEPATSKIYYATTSGVAVNSTSTAYVENANLVKDHDITLSGLSSTTQYYFVAESKDGTGNKRTSGEFKINTTLGL